MNVRTPFTIARHILVLLASSLHQALTSEYIAGSVNTNPVVIRRLLGLPACPVGLYIQAALTGIYGEAERALDNRQGTHHHCGTASFRPNAAKTVAQNEDPLKHTTTRISGGALALLALAATLPLTADTTSDDQDVKDLIAAYAATVSRADPAMAEKIFSDAPGVIFIHPRGESRGRQQIVTEIITTLMGGTFSARKLTPRDITVHVYGDTAWSEFSWDFVATVRKDGSPFHSQGVETQIYRRENGQWRIVHVHYSGAPVTGNLNGF